MKALTFILLVNKILKKLYFYFGGWPYLALLDPMVWSYFSNAVSVAIGYMVLIEGDRC
jgi:hypothetical protein